jgi:hypothetical protein
MSVYFGKREQKVLWDFSTVGGQTMNASFKNENQEIVLVAWVSGQFSLLSVVGKMS